MTTLPLMARAKPELGQKNFALGEAKAIFERWSRRNGYDEKRVFLAGLIALQRLSLKERQHLFAVTDEWLRLGMPADEEGVAAVTTTAAEPHRPADSTTTSRPNSRRAS